MEVTSGVSPVIFPLMQRYLRTVSMGVKSRLFNDLFICNHKLRHIIFPCYVLHIKVVNLVQFRPLPYL
jgi:hypothetical protein